MSDELSKKRIGIAGTTFTVIGFVLGASIFVLPGEMAASIGPSVWVAFLIAGIPASLSCIIAAQAANIFPVSGCAYVGASMVLSPFWGFMVVWNILIAMVVGIPLLAYAFARYFAAFPMIEHLHPTVVAVCVVMIFGLINLGGVKTTVGVQAIMIVLYIVVLIVFGVGGLFHVDLDNIRPIFPQGFTPVLGAAAMACYTFSGFMVIAEMGDDIHDPKRTIPIALFLAFSVVATLYLLIAFVVPGVVPWQALGETNAPIAKAAEAFMPPWFTSLITVSALLGAATSVNAWFLTQSRDVFALARDQVFPLVLSRESRRFGEPYAAILFCTFAACGGVLLGARIGEYAIMTALASFSVFTLISAFVLLAPKRAPEFFRRARFRLGPIALPALAGAFILVSLSFFSIGFLTSPKSGVIYVGLLIPGIAYYVMRKRHLATLGVDIRQLLDRDLSHLLDDDN